MSEIMESGAVEAPRHYRERAELIARQVADRWHDPEDPGGLANAVYSAFVEEANLELRQILTQVSGQLELALRRLERTNTPPTPERLATMKESMDRASSIMETFLDRSSATKHVIRLDCEEFDLTNAMEEHLAMQGLLPKLRCATAPAPIVGDRAKLVGTLGHLVSRFYFASREHEVVAFSLMAGDGQIEGFVGLSPSHLEPEVLMEEIRHPLAVEDVGIDIAYARAVLERHGGSLFVATGGESATGFGFTLPLAKEVDA